MRQYDIEFQCNGETYGFMLAKVDSKKAWHVTRVSKPPPSMIKQRIDLTVTASEDEMMASGVMQLKRIKKILADLETITAKDDGVTLRGFDGQTYPVLLDATNGLNITTLIHEKQREPEYQVEVLVWGLYE